MFNKETVKRPSLGFGNTLAVGVEFNSAMPTTNSPSSKPMPFMYVNPLDTSAYAPGLATTVGSSYVKSSPLLMQTGATVCHQATASTSVPEESVFGAAHNPVLASKAVPRMSGKEMSDPPSSP